ncbi:MAG: TldD/PmbA family protein [Bacillota bacterium]|nr:TldD/PmbA family protein [Bacillota bacterium]
MIERAELEKLLSVALSGGGELADLFLERREGNLILCEEDRIERVGSGCDQGAGVRVVAGETTAYAYTNDLSPEGLRAACRAVAQAVRAGAGECRIELRRREPDLEFPVEVPPWEVALQEKVELVRRANEAARRCDPRIKQVTVAFRESRQEVWLASSAGYFCQDQRVRVNLAVNAVAAEGGRIQTGYESAGGHCGLELFRTSPPEELARRAAERALLMLQARPAPTGRMPVVMAGAAGGTMVHEACGHGLEADLVQKGLSVYQGRLGEVVASPLVTVVDDPTLPGKYGSYRLDDEGTPAQRKVLIERGVLKDYLYDLVWGRRAGRASNGNGRRESYHFPPLPRMSNTFILPGEEDPEEIIAQTKRGLYVVRMGGGEVNTANGDFVFEVSEGYLIEDGRIKGPVRGATLTGNGPRALAMVDRVGNDLGFTIGTCGKDGQGVPVADAQPTIRITELIVGGTLDEGGEGR